MRRTHGPRQRDVSVSSTTTFHLPRHHPRLHPRLHLRRPPPPYPPPPPSPPPYDARMHTIVEDVGRERWSADGNTFYGLEIVDQKTYQVAYPWPATTPAPQPPYRRRAGPPPGGSSRRSRVLRRRRIRLPALLPGPPPPPVRVLLPLHSPPLHKKKRRCTYKATLRLFSPLTSGMEDSDVGVSCVSDSHGASEC